MDSVSRSIHPKSQQGVTLIEIMITVALLTIALAVGVPSFSAQIEKRQLIGLASDMEQVQPNVLSVEMYTPQIRYWNVGHTVI